MRLDHLLSKEKETSSLFKVIVYFSMCLDNKYIENRVKAHKRLQLETTLIYGLIAQMVRAHA